MFRNLNLIFVASLMTASAARAENVTVDSLADLVRYAELSGNTVTLKPGVYALTDLIPLDSAPQRRKQKLFTYLTFSGSNNTFKLDGVTIEIDTQLRARMRPPIHTDEIVIAGGDNTIEGLTITQVGDGKSMGGSSFCIAGDRNIVRGLTLTVRGSAPYGYGDLFGKGGHKQSGLRVTGDNNRVIGCKVFMRAFGHGYYLQDGATDSLIEDCEVEGEMRSTDDILAEREGYAFDHDFRTNLANRDGEHRVTPGYMKAMAEDGFRLYSSASGVTLVNCTAKHMRGGFELRGDVRAKLVNCTAVGNERGFWVGTGARIVQCRGDAKHGPLLFLEGDRAEVDLTLLPDDSDCKVRALATICGTGHRVAIASVNGQERERKTPILVGYSAPPAGAPMAPYTARPLHDLVLRNGTVMPIIVEATSGESDIESKGTIQRRSESVSEVPPSKEGS